MSAGADLAGYVEPPEAGTEAETIIGSLERQRATFAFKCEGLTEGSCGIASAPPR